MTKQKSTKRALLLSVLSLLLCVSMLIGTTYAWFTDSVTSAGNKIVAGTLDVDLLMYDGEEYADISESKAAIFGNAESLVAQNNNGDTLWEPGKTQVAYLAIRNNGTLALKYTVALNVVNPENGKELYKAMEYVISPDKQNGEITAWDGTDAKSVVLGTQTVSDGEGQMKPGDTHYFALSVHMKEEAGNEYQGGMIDFDLTVLATQLTYEEDSFDDQYDADADYAIEVSTADELQKALELGGLVKLLDDVTLADDQSVKVAEGVTATLDLNGKTITGTSHKSVGAVLRNSGTLTIKGGVISSTAANGGSAIQNSGTLVAEDATLNGASNADGSWPSYTVNNTGVMTVTNCKITSVHGAVASYGAGAVLTLNDSEIDMAGIPGFTSHGIYTYSDGSVVVNGGTYANNATDQNATGGSVINGAVTVNAGTFTGRVENYYGTPVIKGGTFSSDVSKYVAEQSTIVNNGDGTWTVVPPIEVSDAEDLANAIETAKEGDTILLTEDITPAETMSVPSGVTLSLDGHSINGTVTALGDLNVKGNAYIKTLTSTSGGTVTVEEGKTLTLNNFSFGSSSNNTAEYEITGGTVTANYGFFQHGTYELHSDFETGYMYYSYGSDITVYGTFHSQGKGDGLDYVRGKVTIAKGGKSIHDKSMWVGQPASWGAMSATLVVEEGAYLQVNSLSVYDGSALQIDAKDMQAGAVDEIVCNKITNTGVVEAINNDALQATVSGNAVVLEAK